MVYFIVSACAVAATYPVRLGADGTPACTPFSSADYVFNGLPIPTCPAEWFWATLHQTHSLTLVVDSESVGVVTTAYAIPPLSCLRGIVVNNAPDLVELVVPDGAAPDSKFGCLEYLYVTGVPHLARFDAGPLPQAWLATIVYADTVPSSPTPVATGVVSGTACSVGGPADVYQTQAEAETRAAQIGCTGFHSHGASVFMPCATHAEYDALGACASLAFSVAADNSDPFLEHMAPDAVLKQQRATGRYFPFFIRNVPRLSEGNVCPIWNQLVATGPLLLENGARTVMAHPSSSGPLWPASWGASNTACVAGFGETASQRGRLGEMMIRPALLVPNGDGTVSEHEPSAFVAAVKQYGNPNATAAQVNAVTAADPATYTDLDTVLATVVGPPPLVVRAVIPLFHGESVEAAPAGYNRWRLSLSRVQMGMVAGNIGVPFPLPFYFGDDETYQQSPGFAPRRFLGAQHWLLWQSLMGPPPIMALRTFATSGSCGATSVGAGASLARPVFVSSLVIPDDAELFGLPATRYTGHIPGVSRWPCTAFTMRTVAIVRSRPIAPVVPTEYTIPAPVYMQVRVPAGACPNATAARDVGSPSAADRFAWEHLVGSNLNVFHEATRAEVALEENRTDLIVPTTTKTLCRLPTTDVVIPIKAKGSLFGVVATSSLITIFKVTTVHALVGLPREVQHVYTFSTNLHPKRIPCVEGVCLLGPAQVSSRGNMTLVFSERRENQPAYCHQPVESVAVVPADPGFHTWSNYRSNQFLGPSGHFVNMTVIPSSETTPHPATHPYPVPSSNASCTAACESDESCVAAVYATNSSTVFPMNGLGGVCTLFIKLTGYDVVYCSSSSTVSLFLPDRGGSRRRRTVAPKLPHGCGDIGFVQCRNESGGLFCNETCSLLPCEISGTCAPPSTVPAPCPPARDPHTVILPGCVVIKPHTCPGIGHDPETDTPMAQTQYVSPSGECVNMTTCLPTEVASGATVSTDRVCTDATIAACSGATYVDPMETTPGKGHSCTAMPVCNWRDAANPEYQVSPGVVSADLGFVLPPVCHPISPCPALTQEVVEPTPTSDRECASLVLPSQLDPWPWVYTGIVWCFGAIGIWVGVLYLL